MTWFRCGNGGSGTNFDSILSHGQISTTSAYATATFSDISDYKYIFIKVYVTINGTEYAGMVGYPITNIPSTGTYTFNIYVGCTNPLFDPLTLDISRTSIASTHYSGEWRNVYVDIVGTTTELFI